MWYKFSKQVFSASAQINKFLSPLPVPEVVENANSNVQLEVAFCYMVAEDKDSPETTLALRSLAQNLYDLKQRKRITTKVSKQEFAIDSIYDSVVFDDFDAIVEHIDYIISQEKPKKDMAATADLEPVLGHEKIKIYNPKTYEESERACVGTSWCIGDRSTGMFLKYRFDDTSNFYIVEDANRSYPFRKVAVDIRPSSIQITDEINDTGEQLMANLVVDGKNYGKSIDGYFQYLSDISGGEIKKEDFVPRALTPEEEESKRKFSRKNTSLSWFMDLSYDDKEAYILRMHDLTFAQFMFMYERKNVFAELLNLISSNPLLAPEINAVILKDPALNRNRVRNKLLGSASTGYNQEEFDEIAQYKLFTVLGRYIQNFIGDFPRLALDNFELNPEMKEYSKKFIAEKIFTAEFPFDLRFFELFSPEEIQNIMPSFSDIAKEKYQSLQSVDGIVDAFAKQEMDIELFEKAIIGNMDVREAISKVQESILANKYKIVKPFSLTKEVLTPEFVVECIKNKLISVEVLGGKYNRDDDFGVYNYGSDIEENERINIPGTVVATLSDDFYDTYDFDIAFQLYAEGLLSESFRVNDLPREVIDSSGELGLEGVYEKIIDKVNQITEIPVSVMNDEIFINLLIKSDKFTLDFARDASEEQKDVIASLPDAYTYARDNKTQVLKAIANESLQEVLKKRFPGLYQVVRKTQPAAALPNDPNATISRQKAMQLLRMRPNDRFHNLEADELGIGSTITMAQFRDVQEEFSRRLMGETVQDYIEEKYMMMMDDFGDDDDNFGY